MKIFAITVLHNCFDSPEIRQELIFSVADSVYELLQELPNDLQLRILAN